MAKIKEAVRAREAAVAGRPRPHRRRRRLPTSPSSSATPRSTTPPEPRVQQPKPRPLPKSARARSEEEPELALDPDAPEAWRTPAALAAAEPLDHRPPPPLERRAGRERPHARDRARRLRRARRDRLDPPRPGRHHVRARARRRPQGLAASSASPTTSPARCPRSPAACSTIPGRSVIGIELPNELREKVLLREILSAKGFGDSAHALPLALGKDIGGEPVVANLARMPHLLIAGTTGSGKSVAINTMILSLLYKLSPAECRLIMIDPKMLELSVYDGIPHLLSPVVTDPKKAVVALKWTVAEMEERYRKMSKMGVRNIDGYNARVKDALARGEAFTRTVQTGFDEETGEPVFETEELPARGRCPSSSSSSTRWPT